MDQTSSPTRYEMPQAPEPTAGDRPRGDGVPRTKPPRQRPAVVPAAPAEITLTDEERALLVAEKAMLIEAGRRGAFRPVSQPEEAPEVLVLDPKSAGKPADALRADKPDVVISRLNEIGRVPAQREQAYIASVREELEPLAKEAEVLHAEYCKLHEEIAPLLGRYLSLNWHLIGRTVMTAVGRSGGSTRCEGLRHQIADLADGLASMSGPSSEFALIPRQIRSLSLSDIRGGLVPELKQAVTQQRGGAAQSRRNFDVIQRQMKELVDKLKDAPVPTPELKGSKNPWNVGTVSKPSSQSITGWPDHDPMRNGAM